jgi:hypothetical protein
VAMTDSSRQCIRRRGSPAPKSFLHAVARQQLNLARHGTAGCATRTICGDGKGPLSHSIVALRAGQALGSEVSEGRLAWTVQVLQGQVVLTVGRAKRFGWPGELMAGPTCPHELVATCDTVLLITTVALMP